MILSVSEYVFFRELSINKFAGKVKRQMDRKFLVTMHTNCHFQLISVVMIKKNVAVDKKSSFIFCTRFGAQNAGNGISELPDFKIFWGSMPPDPPRPLGYTYMLFAGCGVRMVKNCDRGQHFHARGHSFSPYGPT